MGDGVRATYHRPAGILLELPADYRADTAGWSRIDPAGRTVGRVDIDLVPGRTTGDDDAAVVAVLAAVAGQGGELLASGEQTVDRRRVCWQVLRYWAGLPGRDPGGRSEVAGPGATMLVAAVAFDERVRTLAFLAGRRNWAADEPAFRLALASCRFIDGVGPAVGEPLGGAGPEATGGTGVSVADAGDGLSMLAPVDWTWSREPGGFRLSAPSGGPEVTVRRRPPPDPFERWRAERRADPAGGLGRWQEQVLPGGEHLAGWWGPGAWDGGVWADGRAFALTAEFGVGDAAGADLVAAVLVSARSLAD